MNECNLFFNTKKYPLRAHAYQAISGFIALKKQKIISLNIDFDRDVDIPLANAFYSEINGRKVIYDIEDGTNNFLPDTIDYIHKENILLFKRAYDEQLFKYDKMIRPYGLNYINFSNNFIALGTDYLARRKFLPPGAVQFTLSKLQDWSFIDANVRHTNRIFFCTRLWDQNETHSPVDVLNDERIQVILSLRKAFPNNIIAGVQDSPLSRKLCKDLILPSQITRRNNYLDLLSKSSVCIATTGLHRSTGWKFGEYVASGKAIVTEPLSFLIPGDFYDGKNYLSFTSANDLIDKCDYLLSNPEKRREMEKNNIDYYIHNLRPDVLIWNTLKQVIDNSTGLMSKI